MKIKERFSSFSAAVLLGVTVTAAGAAAQPYPSRTVVLVVPFPAGGGADVLCRLVAEKLRTAIGQPFVIDNRSGASGNLGAEFVAKASPDGHTLLCAPDPVFTSHLLFSKLSFDPRAFEPVSVFAMFNMAIVARAGLPVSTMPDLIAYARANPGKLTYASQGNGHFAHLLMETLKFREKLDILHVPYRGGTPAINDLAAGQVDVFAGPLVSTISHINAGTLKLLAPTGERRLTTFPNVATLPETVPGMAIDSWLAIAAPPGTPKEITGKLSAAVATAVHMPDLRARFSELQSEPLGSTPEGMRDMIERATDQWRGVITEAKITID